MRMPAAFCARCRYEAFFYTAWATSGREQVQQNAPQNGHLYLLNDLVGTRKYRRRYLKTQHLGRLEIDGKF
jgi:hypothetical protein